VKIAKIEAIPFSIPYRVPVVIATGTHRLQKSVLVKITAENGMVGLGETEPMPHFQGCNETQETVVSVIRELYTPLLLHENVFDIEKAHRKMEQAIFGANYARTAVGDALYDLAARVLGVPLFDLLGGAYRSKIPVVWSIGRKPPAEMAAEALQKRDAGYFLFKCKIGAQEAKTDLENVAAIRRALGPDAPFHVDGNAGMSYAQALTRLRPMVEAHGLRIVEQPVPVWDIDGLARLAEDLRAPVMADESAYSIQSTMDLVKKRAVSLIDIKLAKVGGIYVARKMAAIAEAAGISVYAGGRPATSIGSAAAAHFAAATWNATEGDYQCGSDGWLAADIVKNPLKVVDGYGIVPQDGPGIGVEIDDAALEKWSVQM